VGVDLCSVVVVVVSALLHEDCVDSQFIRHSSVVLCAELRTVVISRASERSGFLDSASTIDKYQVVSCLSPVAEAVLSQQPGPRSVL